MKYLYIYIYMCVCVRVCVCVCVRIFSWHMVIYEVLCFDGTQGQMNGAPNETRTHCVGLLV